jgi:hypothetical protein
MRHITISSTWFEYSAILNPIREMIMWSNGTTTPVVGSSAPTISRTFLEHGNLYHGKVDAAIQKIIPTVKSSSQNLLSLHLVHILSFSGSTVVGIGLAGLDCGALR